MIEDRLLDLKNNRGRARLQEFHWIKKLFMELSLKNLKAPKKLKRS
jgi:hypothetical protein